MLFLGFLGFSIGGKKMIKKMLARENFLSLRKGGCIKS